MLQVLSLSVKCTGTRLLKARFTGLLSALLLLIGSACAVAQTSSSLDSSEPIPHSTIAEASGTGIVKAMLSCATDRYAHGVLGDSIEAGCLVVEDETAKRYQLDLPQHQVFEDLIPRIVDIDGDGRNDVVLVRSESRQGAALTVYTLNVSDEGQALQELATTPPIGLSNRWLAPVGMADFNKDGAMDITTTMALWIWRYLIRAEEQPCGSRFILNIR